MSAVKIKRLSNPRPKGIVIIPDGQQDAYKIYFLIDQVEQALILAGAKPNEDYKFMDLLNVAIKLKTNDELVGSLAGIEIRLSQLGTGNAFTDMGAIELLSLSVKEGFSALASAVENA